MVKLLKELCRLDGVSGYEDEVRDFILGKIKPHANEIVVDPVGNVIAFKKGAHRRMRPLLVNAHMDEVGYLVWKITDSGLIKIAKVGGIDPRVVIGQRMRVGPDKVKGVIALKAFHLTKPEDRVIAPKEWELSLDIGASSFEEACSIVKVGQQAVFDSEPSDFGDNCLKAKALDDRMGCAIMMTILEEDLEYDTHFAFTANEEIGLRGAPVLARSDPGVVLTIETTTAVDIPGVPGHMGVTKLRGGVAIALLDLQTAYNRRYIEKLAAKATAEGIKWQYRIMSAGAVDGGVIHREGSGAIAVTASLPSRYSHTADPVCYLPDLEEVLKFSRLVIREAGECDV